MSICTYFIRSGGIGTDSIELRSVERGSGFRKKVSAEPRLA